MMLAMGAPPGCWSAWDRRSCLRSVLVEPRPSDAGDPDAGWFLRDTGRCAVIDQSVERIRQSAVVEPGAGGGLQILERHTSLAVLGIKGGQDLQNGDTLQCIWPWSPGSHPASWLGHVLMDHVATGTANRQVSYSFDTVGAGSGPAGDPDITATNDCVGGQTVIQSERA